MKKVFLPLVIWLLLISISFADGGDTIYLPIIEKGDSMSNAILEITDGTVTIDLLQAGIAIGVDGWNLASPPTLPTMQQSPLTDGAELSSYKRGNAVENIGFKVGGAKSNNSEDDVIHMVQDFRRILISGMNYQVVDWHNSIVYIRARDSCETNIRYAVVKTYSLPEDDAPFEEPFINDQVMDVMSVVIERGDWLGAVPGVGECQPISSQQDWQYKTEWVTQSAAPTAASGGALKTANGDLYLGYQNEIFKSTNDGINWVLNLNGAPISVGGVVNGFLEAANGDIYATESGQILRTQNQGGAWFVNTVLPDDVAYDIIQNSVNGDIYSTGGSLLIRSQNNGGAWATVVDLSSTNDLWRSLLQTENGDIYAGTVNGVLYRARPGDSWATWTIIATLPSQIWSLLQASDGSIYAGLFQEVYKSTDGVNFSLNTSLSGGGTAQSLIQITNGDIYVGAGEIERTENNGADWVIDDDSVFVFAELVQADSGDIFAARSGVIRRKIISDAIDGITLGGESGSDCSDDIYISNKSNIANLTHIKIDDGGAFTDIFPIAAFPQDLLPAVPVVNDAVYFGIDTSIIDSGPFSSLVFDLEDIITSSVSYTITWEYWNGAWVALTVTDNTDSIGVFTNININSVHWEQPTDWATTAVDGVTGYWIRARVSALVGAMTPPSQKNNDIYSITNSHIEVDDGDIGGDIPALAEFKIKNESDKDGKSGSAPDLWSNRIVTGLRSLSRGENFRAFINISDEQNVPGITVTAGTNAAFVNFPATVTGRRLTYSALAGDTSFVARATIDMSSAVVRDYYGKFHVFLRGRQVDGVAGDITVRLVFKTGSGGITFTTPEVTFSGNNNWELLDFDSVTMPAGGRVITPDNLGDLGEISVQAKNDSGASRSVLFHDLVLIPTDEWAGDFTDLADIDDSIIGRQDDIKHFIDIDSVRNPKVLGRSLVRLDDSNESISANYEFAPNGEVMLQANADQRLWVLSAHIGSNDEWLSEPWVGWSVQASKNQRYLTQRGSR